LAEKKKSYNFNSESYLVELVAVVRDLIFLGMEQAELFLGCAPAPALFGARDPRLRSLFSNAVALRIDPIWFQNNLVASFFAIFLISLTFG
jgi:hypothetical protein